MCESSETVARRLAAAGCVAPVRRSSRAARRGARPGHARGWLVQREAGMPLAWIVGARRSGAAGWRSVRASTCRGSRPRSWPPARRGAPPGRAGPRRCAPAAAPSPPTSWRRSPAPRVVGVDIDPVAASWAHRNGVAAVVADLAAPVRGRFDVVTAVPPYVPTGGIRLLPRTSCASSPTAPSTVAPTALTWPGTSHRGGAPAAPGWLGGHRARRRPGRHAAPRPRAGVRRDRALVRRRRRPAPASPPGVDRCGCLSGR